MLKDQILRADGKDIELVNRFNDDKIIKMIQERKNDSYGDKGFTAGKTMREVCHIPTFLVYKEPLLKEFMLHKSQNPEYARKCLRKWLSEHPEYKANMGNI